MRAGKPTQEGSVQITQKILISLLSRGAPCTRALGHSCATPPAPCKPPWPEINKSRRKTNPEAAGAAAGRLQASGRLRAAALTPVHACQTQHGTAARNRSTDAQHETAARNRSTQPQHETAARRRSTKAQHGRAHLHHGGEVGLDVGLPLVEALSAFHHDKRREDPALLCLHSALHAATHGSGGVGVWCCVACWCGGPVRALRCRLRLGLCP